MDIYFEDRNPLSIIKKREGLTLCRPHVPPNEWQLVIVLISKLQSIVDLGFKNDDTKFKMKIQVLIN